MPAVSVKTGTFALAAVLALAMSYDLWRTPIQVYDSLDELLAAQQSRSVSASFIGSTGTSAYLRPLRIAQIKALFDVAQGHYQLVYRGFHVLLLLALLFFFTRALRVQSSVDGAAAAFALTVLIGLHTFQGFVREAFPINHFLEIAVLCVASLNLLQSRGGWWSDAAAALLFVGAALTLESGLLVWVVIAAGWICGYRGVSTSGLVLITLLLAGYFFLRFEYLATGVPALTERSSGFMLEVIEPDELQRRFGAAPLAFYAYNVAASICSVLFSEPRNGVFVGLRSWRDGDVPPRVYLMVASSVVTTTLIIWAAVARWRSRGSSGDGDRLITLAAVVLVANAVLSFAYTKDDVVAVAGVFYALAAFAAVHRLIERVGAVPSSARVFVASAMLLLLASVWTVRTVAVHHALRAQTFRIRNDWAEVPLRLRLENRWPTNAKALALIDQLRTEALDARVPNAELRPEWQNRWFGD